MEQHAVDARVGQQQGDPATPWSQLSDQGRRAMVEAFGESLHLRTIVEAAARGGADQERLREFAIGLATSLVYHGCDVSPTGPCQWAPAELGGLLCSAHVAGLMERGDETLALAVTAAWVRFSASLATTVSMPATTDPDGVVAQLGAAAPVLAVAIDMAAQLLEDDADVDLDELQPQEEVPAGMAERLLSAMAADGVDPDDTEHAEAWLRRFNDLPIDERARVLDGQPADGG